MKITFPSGIIVDDCTLDEVEKLVRAVNPPPEIKIARTEPEQAELALDPPKEKAGRKRPTFAEFGKVGFLGSHFRAKAVMFVVALALKKHYPRPLGRSELSAGACTILNGMASGSISDQNAYDAAVRLECVGIAVRRRTGHKSRIRWMLDPGHISLDEPGLRMEIDRIPDRHEVWMKRASIERGEIALPETPEGVPLGATVTR